MPSPPLTRSRATTNAAKKLGIPLSSHPFSNSCSSFLGSSSTIITSAVHCSLALTPPTIATTAPTISPFPTNTSPPSTNGMNPPHKYNLHPRSHLDGHPPILSRLGLSLLGSIIQSSWGRKSYLSKAIQRIREEVATSRQSTLEWVLRPMITPAGFPMNFLSFNYRGMASASKKLALCRLFEVEPINIIMLQETLGQANLIS